MQSTKGALELLTVIVEERVGGITDDINNKCESLRDMVLKIYNKVSKPKVKSNTVGSSRCSPKEPIAKKTKRKLKVPSGASKPFVSSSPGTKSTPKPSPVWSSRPNKTGALEPNVSVPPKPTYASTTRADVIPRSYFNKQPKVLYVADSVGHSASMRGVEKAQKVRIRTAHAYSSVNDVKARWPEWNFTDQV